MLCKIIVFLGLCINGALLQSNSTPVPIEIQEALRFSQVIEQQITEYMQHKLPFAAQPDAQKILDTVRAGLANCESQLQRIDEIWQYKTCSSTLLANAMEDLGKLTGEYYAAHNTAASLAKSGYAVGLVLSYVVLNMN